MDFTKCPKLLLQRDRLRKSSGREFRVIGPATAKAQQPKVRWWRGTV